MALTRWYDVVCELCGMVVAFGPGGSESGYPSACQANAGGPHQPPRSWGAYRADTARGARELWAQEQAEATT